MTIAADSRSGPSLGPDDPARRHGTVADRRAFWEERRERTRPLNGGRETLARELAGSARHAIPHSQGFESVTGEELPFAASVIEQTNEVIDSIGHEQLLSGKTKGGFLARGFLPDDVFLLDSPYMRFALDEALVAPIAAYLGVVPILTEIDVWYSAHGPNQPKSSQLWHLDPADVIQVKVWVHCSDVGEPSGPLTVVDATRSEMLADRVGYRFDEKHYRVPDDDVRDVVGEDAIAPLTGRAGTVSFADTSRCFHFGSRVSEGAPPRRMMLFQYLTPYAFEFESDHRAEAPLRKLADGANDELARLVLGAE